MTKKQVKEILDRILTWPAKRQEDAARVLTEMEEQHTSPYHLTHEQAQEVGRRRADFTQGREPYALDGMSTSGIFTTTITFCKALLAGYRDVRIQRMTRHKMQRVSASQYGSK